jgi:serine/threonine protein kinase
VDEPALGSGFVLGTANYVAPELCDYSGSDGPAADIFSLGVTLYELLTGDLPYPNGTVEETMVRHRDGQADSLWSWDGGWPIGLSSLVDRMLDRKPAIRPTAAEVADELTTLFPMMAPARQVSRR